MELQVLIRLLTKILKFLPNNSTEALEFLNQKNSDEKDEFNISFTNENYNPMEQIRNKYKNSLERTKLNKEDIIINTREQMQVPNQYSKPNKLIHLSENYNNDKNYKVVDGKSKHFRSKKEVTRKEVRQKFGSPIPEKKNKKTASDLSEVKAPIPIFGGSLESGFPDLPVNTDSLEDDKEINSNWDLKFQEKTKKNSKRGMVPDVKILDLQHNLLQMNSWSNVLFNQNGEVIDSGSLRKELKALYSTESKSKGKLVKPKSPLDLASVSLNSVIFN